MLGGGGGSSKSSSFKLSDYFLYLDFHPKTQRDAQQKSTTGAVVTVFFAILLGYLMLSEWREFRLPKEEDTLVVDLTLNERAKIYFDMTFPRIPCLAVSLDAVDMHGDQQNDVDHHIVKTRLDARGNPIVSGKQKDLGVKTVEPFVPEGYCGPCYGTDDEETKCCNTCEQLRAQFVKHNKQAKFVEGSEQCLRENKINQNAKSDVGCHLFGHLIVNKMKGNFHVAVGAGQAEGHQEHAHHVHRITMQMLKEFDSTHMIQRLAFGEPIPDIHNPLDNSSYHMGVLSQVKYTLQIVPTSYTDTNGKTISTNQYTYTKSDVHVDFTKPTFQLPGVFFEYDWTPLRVKIVKRNNDFGHLLVRLCAVIGGLYVMLGVFYFGVNRVLTLLNVHNAGSTSAAATPSPSTSRAQRPLLG